MRIGIDAACFLEPKSGVAEYTINLVRGLAELRDMEFIMSCNSVRGLDSLPDLGQARARIVSRRLPRKLLSLLGGRMVSLERLMGTMDLFHSPNYHVPVVRRAKLVVTVHDLVVAKFPQFQFAARNFEISRALSSLGRADCVIAVSESTKKDLIEFLGLPESRIAVIYNGCNPQFSPDIDEATISLTLAKYGVRRPFILNVGTIEPRKNQARLIEAFQLLCHQEAKEHSLVIVGRPGWSYDGVFARVRELGLSDRLVFTGHVPDGDLPPLVKAADLFVFPSLYEGFGFPPLEAMASGTPVVTSDVSSLPEVVGKAAILVDPHDVISIAAGMKLLLEDETLREQLINEGLQRAKLFSWQETAAETLRVYDNLLGN